MTVDNGTEFASKAMDLWAYTNGVHLDFIRPGRPVENGYSESFNGRLRDEFLNVELCFTLADARRKLHGWRRDYDQHRSHSAPRERTPAEFAAICSGANAGNKTALEDAQRFPLLLRTATAGRTLKQSKSSSLLLETLTWVTLAANLPEIRHKPNHIGRKLQSAEGSIPASPIAWTECAKRGQSQTVVPVVC